MEFVDSGAKALQAMSATPFDIIVSDMRMPEMSGAQLLNEIMRVYPRTIRLILSGHADNDLVMKSVGSTHQYLSKPCDPETLRNTVRRAMALNASLENETLKRLVSQMECIPSLPSLYVEIVEELQNPDCALKRIGEIVSSDLGMSAKLLKLVNSSFFGLRRVVSSPIEAASFLGIDTIKSLVLSMKAFSQFDQAKMGEFSIERLWRHSLATGAYARLISRTENAGQKTADEAFTAGMLHDAGKLILAYNFPAEYRNIMLTANRERQPLDVIETAVFHANHADVGGYLLGLWGLPAPVVEAIALHHTPEKCIEKAFSPLAAVHTANVMEQQRNGCLFGVPSIVNEEYIREIGLYEHIDLWRGSMLAIA